MSNDRKNNSIPTTDTSDPNQSGRDSGTGVGSAEYSEYIRGGRDTFEVVNSMPSPPNPNQGGGKDNQGE